MTWAIGIFVVFVLTTLLRAVVTLFILLGAVMAFLAGFTVALVRHTPGVFLRGVRDGWRSRRGQWRR